MDYIEATIDDYRIAYELAHEVLTQTLHDLKKHSRELLSEIIAMVTEKANASSKETHDIIFSRRDVREYTNWSDRKLKECLYQLEDLEYLSVVSGSKGKTYFYYLPESLPLTEFSLDGLISPDELKKKL